MIAVCVGGPRHGEEIEVWSATLRVPRLVDPSTRDGGIQYEYGEYLCMGKEDPGDPDDDRYIFEWMGWESERRAKAKAVPPSSRKGVPCPVCEEPDPDWKALVDRDVYRCGTCWSETPGLTFAKAKQKPPKTNGPNGSTSRIKNDIQFHTYGTREPMPKHAPCPRCGDPAQLLRGGATYECPSGHVIRSSKVVYYSRDAWHFYFNG